MWYTINGLLEKKLEMVEDTLSIKNGMIKNLFIFKKKTAYEIA